MTRLSLRLRIFLFFALLGLGGFALAELALWLGYRRAATAGVEAGFVMSGIILAFGLPGLAVAIWLLFDENVAKPIERLAATLRVRAHAGVEAAVDTHAARYLGDLAPAAVAVSTQLNQTMMDRAGAIAAETARLAAEKESLAALLTEVPVAMVVVNAAHQIVLYDGQAAEALAQVSPPRLNAPIFDYVDEECLRAAHDELTRSGAEVRFTARGRHGRFDFDARLKPLSSGQGYMLVIDDAHARFAPDAARPVIYDFSLMERAAPAALADVPLDQLAYMVFDTETTGLLPHRDDIVQVGAVRVVNGRIVPGEVIDRLVDPGRPIPPASTKVHGVSDAMVQGAPGPVETVRLMHDFARGAVIVAHNAPFDMAFMKRYGKTDGLDWDHPILDTVLLSAVLFGTSETHTLDALCERLGVTIPDELRHTALGDARATAEALVRMLPMLMSRGLTTLPRLIEETRKHGRLIEDMN